jgi:hypothetical protein
MKTPDGGGNVEFGSAQPQRVFLGAFCTPKKPPPARRGQKKKETSEFLTATILLMYNEVE